AEDGIRDYKVTGVQTCALPICERPPNPRRDRSPRRSRFGGVVCKQPIDGCTRIRRLDERHPVERTTERAELGGGLASDAGRRGEIGRASCRERGEISGVAGSEK